MKIHQRFVTYGHGYSVLRLARLLRKLGAGDCLFDFTLQRQPDSDEDVYFMELTVK